MSARAARFEIVRNDNGFHARFRASNGRLVWWTETHTKRIAAVRAVQLIAGGIVHVTPFNEHAEIHWAGDMERPTEVREIDERTQP